MLPEIKITAALRTMTGITKRGLNLKIMFSGIQSAKPQTKRQERAMENGAAVRASSQLSLPNIRRICRLVAPNARRMPISSLRPDRIPSMLPAIPTQQLRSRAKISTPAMMAIINASEFSPNTYPE